MRKLPAILPTVCRPPRRIPRISLSPGRIGDRPEDSVALPAGCCNHMVTVTTWFPVIKRAPKSVRARLSTPASSLLEIPELWHRVSPAAEDRSDHRFMKHAFPIPAD
jgi:hypothetical protein